MHEVTLGITTWAPRNNPDRSKHLARTLEALRVNLDATGCKVQLVIAAETDDTPLAMQRRIEGLAVAHGFTVLWHEPPPLLARNLENLWAITETPYYFNMQDDWLLHRKLALAESIAYLEENEQVGIVRYRRSKRGRTKRRLTRGKTFTLQKGDFAKRSKRHARAVARSFFSHAPYVGKMASLRKLLPLPDTEVGVRTKARKQGFDIAVCDPSCFFHVGKQTTIYFGGGIDVGENWKP